MGFFKTQNVQSFQAFWHYGISVFKTNFNQFAASFFEEHAIEKLNTKLLYRRKLNHIPLHSID